MMKQKPIALALSASLLLALLAGCAAKQPAQDSPAPAPTEPAPDVQEPTDAPPQTEPDAPTEEPTEPDVPTEEPIEPDTPEEPAASFRNPYRALLNRYSGIFDLPADSEARYDLPGSSGLMDTAQEMSQAEALQACGYAVRDLSGDGVPELLIGSGSGIFALYTLQNEKPVFVFEGWYRNLYQPLSDGHFYYTGASSAFSSGFGELHLSEDGQHIVWDKFCFSDLDADTEHIVYLTNTTGEWDAASGERLAITEDEFYAMDDALRADVIDAGLTSFADFRTGQPCDVSLSFAEDASFDLEKATTFVADDSEYNVTIVFSSASSLRDFRLLSLSFTDYDDLCGIEFAETEVAQLGALEPGAPIVVTLSFPGDTPSWGFRYVDENNELRRFYFETSGKDGSLFAEEY